ncbi:acyl carrier protein [Erythrobacter rubeus]|uniref:Acyl carrier protein n=1 Tax=Erythrobacter rubeus TaxID=2760803 RepID=A0ABR8KU52_9SPHN|nr:acyl carrier protein [Erythrobacter rubeus]MBD2841666.1 acyl carrier protein [Erythrobacter rubeus]
MGTNPVTTGQHDAATQGSGETESSGIKPSRAEIDARLKAILVDVLGIEAEDAAEFGDDTGLFGHLPELDSMAVAGLLTEMEDRLDIVIDDDDVDGEMLETYGGLLAFAEAKIVTD